MNFPMTSWRVPGMHLKTDPMLSNSVYTVAQHGMPMDIIGEVRERNKITAGNSSTSQSSRPPEIENRIPCGSGPFLMRSRH